MNNKGQLTVGTFIVMAVAVIVALTLLTGGISSSVGAVTQKVQITNLSVTTAAAGSYVDLPYQAISNVLITNRSSGATIPATNYTITNYVVSNGQLVTRLTSLGGSDAFQGKAVNFTGLAEPFGYDTSAGGRTMSSLIIVLAALALVVVILGAIMKEKLLDVFN